MTTPQGGQLYRTVQVAKVGLLTTTGLTASRLVCHPHDPQREDLMVIAEQLELELYPFWGCQLGTVYVLPKE